MYIHILKFIMSYYFYRLMPRGKRWGAQGRGVGYKYNYRIK